MLSIEMIRKDPEYVYQALRRRGEDIPIPKLVEMDGRRRQAIQKGDELRARRNDESKRIARMREKPQDLIEELRRVGEEIKLLEQESTGLEAEIRDFLLELPNIPLDDVPEGTSEEDNVVVRTWREPRSLEFTPRPHWELGEELGIIDFQRGVKLSGSRFFILTGMGCKAGAGANQLDAGPARQRARLQRDIYARGGETGGHGGLGQPAQVWQ